MQIRHWVSSLCVLLSMTSLAFSGVELNDPNGKVCPPQGGDDGDGGLDDSDPIDLSNGGFQHYQTDLVIPGRGLDFKIERFYKSFSGLQATIEGSEKVWPIWDPIVETPIGQHWDFTYNMRVSIPAPAFDDGLTEPGGPESPEPIGPGDEVLPDILYVSTGKGRIDTFDRYSPTEGGYASVTSPAHFSNLNYKWRLSFTTSDQPVVLTDASLTRYEFFAGYSTIYVGGGVQTTELSYAGRLKSITDRNGNQILFTWQTSSFGVERIDYATDTLGNNIDFIYHDESFGSQASPLATQGIALDIREQLIWAIEDHAGRAFEYNYSFGSGFPMLASVTTPAIVKDGDFSLPVKHERFPVGRTWKYEYDDVADTMDWWTGRMLTTITSPNGDIITENEYQHLDVSLVNLDRNHGRVKRQRYGSAYYNYIVTTTSGSINLPTYGSVSDDYYVWVNDRRGAITRFKYSGDGPGASGFHHQLLEKIEFKGFDTNPDRRTWATESGGVYSWFYFDEATGDPVEIPGGLRNQDGTSASGIHAVRSWNTNSNWDLTFVGEPNGDERHIDLWRANGPGPGSGTDDPLRWGAVEKLTINDQNGLESITQEWKYDFSLSGAGGGCGCGSNGFITAHKDGEGYVTLKHFDDTNGDLLAIYHDMPSSYFSSTIPPANISDAAAVDSYLYNSYGQVVEHTHPSKMTLDDQGFETLETRVDTFKYGSVAGTNEYGRLIRSTIDFGDSSHANLLTQYEYDSVGNVVKTIEPDLDYVEYLYNQDFELVQERRYDATGTTTFAQTDYFYDANGNLVKQEILDLDGAQQPVGSIITINEYDIHDYLVTSSREAGVFTGLILEDVSGSGRFIAPVADSAFVTQKWIYDGGKNLIEFQNGEAVNGIGLNQTENIVEYEYDARDLMVTSVQGGGSASALITAYEYDENERRIRTIVDPDNIVQTQTNEVVYDAFDRIVNRTDPKGNEYQYQYDDNYNLISIKVFGPVVDDTDGSSGNVMLAEVSRVYGKLDLLESQSVELFDYDYTPPGYSNASSGQQLTLYEYNDDSSVRKITTPAGNGTVLEQNLYYDTASRIEIKEDIAGNISQYEYDTDSNVAKMIQTDISSIDGSFELFEVTYEYDALDRRIEVLDGVGNLTKTKYDSRSNVLEQEDARTNISAYTYDSMSRQLTTSLGNGIVTAAKAYDASNRLVSEIDANGNETEYEYDGLNRLTKIIMPDGEFYQAQYDANGNMSQYTDARGVVVTQSFDLNNRLTHRDIAGTSIPGSTVEDYTYDGLGRLRTAKNDFTKVTREYDSRSNIVRELQNIDAAGSFPITSDCEVAYEFDLANNTTKLTYPGGRDVYRTFDELNRMAGIFNDDLFTDPITEFEYIGRRLQRREHGNGTRTDYTYDGIDGVPNAAGDFGFGRVAGITTTKVSSSNTLDAFAFAWDKTQNRTVYDDTGSGMKNRRERAFGYDAANRLVSTDVDFPSPLTDFTSPTNNGITTYTLDGVYNRTDVNGFESNGAPIGTYSQTGDQAKNNQYTITPRADGGEWMNLHDENGNLISKYQTTIADFNGDHAVNFFDVSAFLQAFQNLDASADLNGDGVWNFFDVSTFLGANTALDGTALEQWYYTYDFRNQLIEAKQVFGLSTVTAKTTSTYDAAARRVIESLDPDDDGVADAARHLIYGCASLWEVVEQIDIATDTTILTHVYGLGIDDEVSYQYEELGVPKDIWTHRDDLNSLTSITDSNGDVQERYEYGDYGKVAVFDAGGILRPASGFNAQHLYTGRSLISGTGLYDYRYRVMEPETGKFNQRDPIGTADSLNMYMYGRSNALRYSDPFGLRPPEEDLPYVKPDGCLREDVYTANWTNWRNACKKALKAINGLKYDVQRTLDDLNQPNNSLPEAMPGDDKKPRTSRRGHRWLLDKYRTRLKQLEEFVKEKACNSDGPPPPAGPNGYKVPKEVPIPPPWLVPLVVTPLVAPMLPKIPWWKRIPVPAIPSFFPIIHETMLPGYRPPAPWDPVIA